MSRLRDPKVWFGLGITVLFLWLAVRDVDIGEVGRAMARANWVALVGLSAPAYVASIYFRALRWRHLTDPVKPIGTGPLFRATAVAFMANNLIPLRVGEVLRAWYLARETGASGTALFGTVVLERVIDSAVFLLMIGVIVLVYGFRLGGLAAALGPTLLVILSAPMAGVVAIRLWPGRMVALVRRLGRPLSEPLAERVAAALGSFAEGLGAISAGTHLFWITLHTLMIWVVLSLIPFLVGIWALGIDLGSPTRTLAAGFVTLTAVGLAVAVPSAPGFFGPYHLACREALGLFGVDKDAALAMGTLVHAVFWLTMVLAGLAVLRLRRTSLTELEQHGSLDDLAPAGSGKDPAPGRR